MDDKKMNYQYQVDQEASANARIPVDVNGEIFDVQVTGRYGTDAKKLVETTEAVIEALVELRNKHPRPTAGQAKPPVNNPSPEEILGEPVYEDIELEPPAGKQWITFDADILKVLPQPEGKVTLEFYRSGQKYAGVKVNKWKVDAAQGLLKHVTSSKVTEPAQYDLRCRVYYTEGKEGKTEDGKVFHYKDVSHVRPR